MHEKIIFLFLPYGFFESEGCDVSSHLLYHLNSTFVHFAQLAFSILAWPERYCCIGLQVKLKRYLKERSERKDEGNNNNIL